MLPEIEADLSVWAACSTNVHRDSRMEMHGPLQAARCNPSHAERASASAIPSLPRVGLQLNHLMADSRQGQPSPPPSAALQEGLERDWSSQAKDERPQAQVCMWELSSKDMRTIRMIKCEHRVSRTTAESPAGFGEMPNQNGQSSELTGLPPPAPSQGQDKRTSWGCSTRESLEQPSRT